jgi:Divergent InlB B-repeat domain
MHLRMKSMLSGMFAFVCVILSAGLPLHAAENDDDDGPTLVPLTATQLAQADLVKGAPTLTVPLTSTAILPWEYDGDVRDLPQAYVPNYYHMWNEFPEPPSHKPMLSGSSAPMPLPPNVVLAPMPSPSMNFPGLSFTTSVTGGTAGAGWPPDTNGDVGPTYYIQAVNDAWAIFSKSTGSMVAAFTENQLWSGAGVGTPCNANNFGDPVVMHDGLADRWILTNFAFSVSGGNPVAPFYQCVAVSKTSDPVAGGWYLYAVQIDTGGTGAPPAGTLNDYPKFGLWTDCLYMGANGFTASSGAYAGAIFAAFDRTALFAGSALTSSNSSIGFISNANDPFTMIPANLLGTSVASQPPSGTSEYFVSESNIAFNFEVRKFQAGATACGTGSSLSAETDVSQATYGYPANVAGTTTNIVSQPSVTRKLDSLGDRLMQRVAYRRVGSTESLWVVHTTCGTGQSAAGTCISNTTTTQPQWAQIDVTGGVISTTPVQQQIYTPDTTLYRWMGSLAVDQQGNMAVGYSTSSGSSPNFPSLAYSGRLASDPLNNLPQTEVQLAAGLGSQNGCGTGCTVSRWGDYSAMTIDPSDDCTFWYTNEYYATATHATNARWDTQIGSFKFSSCGSVVTHTVTPSVTGNGTITPNTPQTINDGSTTSFTVSANSGNHLVNVTGTCGGSLVGSTYTTNAITADCTVIANFAVTTHTVTPSVTGSGAITPNTPQTVNDGSTTSFTVSANSGNHFVNVTGTCGGSLVGSTYTTNAVTADCTVIANYAINTYTLTYSAGANGSISGTSPQTVNFDDSGTAVTAVPNSGYHFVQWSDSSTANPRTDTNVQGDISVTVSFAANILVFTTQPADLTRGSVLSTVVVSEQDGSGNTMPDNATVDFTIAMCGGTLDLGSIAMSNGVATLDSAERFYTIASGLTLSAAAGGMNATSSGFSVTAGTDFVFGDGFEACRP